MAIRRCPYCKAIIDEQDKYCNNCGTQLLFPEDEFVEEEIPGDKIVDEDRTKEGEQEEEKIEDGEEREETKTLAEEVAEDEEEEDEEELEEVEEEETEEEDDSEELEEPEEEKEEDEEEGADKEAEELELEAEEEAEEKEPEEEELEEPVEEIRTEELVGKLAQADEPEKKYKVSIEEDELVIKTKELDNLTGTVDEGKEKLEEFLSSFQKKKAKAVTPHEVPALFQEGEEPASTTKEIPPWASGMKEAPPPSGELEEGQETETKGEIETWKTPTRPEWTTDSGIGIPEKVTQVTLPFGDTAVPATGGEIEEEAEEEEREVAGAETRQQAGFSLKLKSKLVDLVLITALWLITLWFTAQVIGVSFLRVIAGSPVPVLALYFILLLLYFFLFLYFLGETLGDHYFSEED